MKILVTGAAGFIGFHLSKKLVGRGHEVIGLDNLNDYYDPDLKYARLGELGIDRQKIDNTTESIQSMTHPLFGFIRMDLEDQGTLPLIFKKYHFDVVCNLAAQAGVRYSLENPKAYIDSNIVGFLNLLECCRNHGVEHLVYASSSSVYGLNEEVPFQVAHPVDRPISLYAASKRSNELMAYTYSHLFGIRTTGLRFFTVYGPWGRPDMALFLFTDAILKDRPIKVFNNGEQERDFTYIDDIIDGMVRIVEDAHGPDYDPQQRHHLYNIGNGKPVGLLEFIGTLESILGKKAKRQMAPRQAGDVDRTWADTAPLERDYGYRPDTPIEKGVREFVRWYRSFYPG